MTVYVLGVANGVQSAPASAQVDANGLPLPKGSNLAPGCMFADLSSFGAGQSNPAPGSQAFAVVVVGTGTVSASVQIVSSNDGVNWIPYGAAIATTAAAGVSIGKSSGAVVWPMYSAYVTVATGTITSIKTTMNC